MTINLLKNRIAVIVFSFSALVWVDAMKTREAAEVAPSVQSESRDGVIDAAVVEPCSPVIPNLYRSRSGKPPTQENLIHSLRNASLPLAATDGGGSLRERREKADEELLYAVTLLRASPEAEEALLECINNSENEMVKGACINALGRLGYPAAETETFHFLKLRTAGIQMKYVLAKFLLERAASRPGSAIRFSSDFLADGFLVKNPVHRRGESDYPVVGLLALMKKSDLALRDQPFERETLDDVLQKISNSIEAARRDLLKAGLELPPPDLPPEGEGGPAPEPES